MEKEENKKPLLILNFDINKTIILGDKSKNFDVKDGIISAIVEYSWGKYDESSKNWTLTENYLSFKRPKPDLINYDKYLKKIYTNKKEEEIPDKDIRYEKNKEIKKMREKVYLKFIEKGQPGEKLHDKYIEILNKVKIPKNIMEEINKENSKYPSFYKDIFFNDYIFIFHSLFRSMLELKNKNRQFVLIFRTFGSDFNNVIKEYNSFCEGEHPIFNGENEKYPKQYFDGTHNSKDYRIIEDNIGITYRFDDNIENTFLVLGTLKRLTVEKPDELWDYYKEQLTEGKIKIIKGGKSIFEYITNNSINGKINSFCINDHYSTWFKYDKKSICGKPMLVDPDNKNVEVFFFDDNIEDSETSIVDCRNVVTGESIKSKDFTDKFLVKADTLKAAEDEYYYLNKIEEAENKK